MFKKQHVHRLSLTDPLLKSVRLHGSKGPTGRRRIFRRELSILCRVACHSTGLGLFGDRRHHCSVDLQRPNCRGAECSTSATLSKESKSTSSPLPRLRCFFSAAPFTAQMALLEKWRSQRLTVDPAIAQRSLKLVSWRPLKWSWQRAKDYSPVHGFQNSSYLEPLGVAGFPSP